MAYEQKNNSGSLFRNDRREKDSHPHAKGSALIDGVEYWVSAWTKTDRNGEKFQSLSFTAKQERRAEPGKRMSYSEASGGSYGSSPSDLLDDEVPFLMEWRG